MTSRTITNVLLAVIAISLAGPQVVDLVNRFLVQPLRDLPTESKRQQACEKAPGDWGVALVPDRLSGELVRMVLPFEIGVENCKLKRPSTVDQIPEEEMRKRFLWWQPGYFD